MRKARTAFFAIVLMVFLGVPLQKSLADNKWQPEEIERLMRLNDSGIKVRLRDPQTIEISISDIEVTNNRLVPSNDSDRTCGPNNIALALQNIGMSKSEIARNLIDILAKFLYQMELAKSYDYAKTDPLFRQLIEVLSSLDWANEDLGWWLHYDGVHSYLDTLSRIVSRSSRRYGVSILEILATVQNQYASGELPDRWKESRELLVDTLKWTRAHTIRSLLLEAEGVPLEERLDMASKEVLARELVNLYAEGAISIYEEELERLAKFDPQTARDIEYIKIERELKSSP